MKKFALTMAIIAIFAAFVCTAVACRRGDELLLYAPDGAPALSVAKIINDGCIGDATTRKQSVVSVVTTGEEVTAKCGNGEADLAVLPTNAAVKICSVRDDYALFSVNVYGVLYIVGTQQLTDLKDLQGKRLYSIGEGNTPEYVFEKICDQNKVSYEKYDEKETLYGKVMLKYFKDASEIIPQIIQGNADFALLGEPAATQLIGKLLEKNKPAYNLFNLQTLWQQATDSDAAGYPQASLIVKRSLLSDGDFRARLDASLSANSEFLNANATKIKDVLCNAGSALQINFTNEIFERCNLIYTDAYAAKADIEKYLAEFDAMRQYLPLQDDIFGRLAAEE